ncbi:peptidoglycan-binding protein [Luteimonas sp. Y-2-2-4F]|nr:peptidoglycan-binding protein [Luteimonas sp. Y-2-2-4F]MCD9030248.1 peptidoglycan-binding protein [Luteimonas sp. Y-2-2-4F]
MSDIRSDNAVATARAWNQGAIAGLDDAMTRRLVASTVYTESNGGDLAITNAQGYVGRYQAGAGWLADAGLVDRERYDRALRDSGHSSEWNWAVSGGMTRFLQDPANWNDGHSLERYVASADLQDAAFKRVSDAAYRQALGSGVLHEGDSPEHIAGILKARHIAGPGGAAQVIQGRSVSDANGTSNASYYNDIAIDQDRLDARLGLDPARERSVLIRGALADGRLELDERGEGVRQLQESLQARGYAVGTPDGQFGPNTQARVRDYQRDQGLPQTGVADAAMLESLGVGRHIHAMPDRALDDGRLQRGEMGDSVRRLQQALADQGQPLQVDGDFGRGTQDALRRFQERAGLEATGVADRTTLQRLELDHLLTEHAARREAEAARAQATPAQEAAPVRDAQPQLQTPAGGAPAQDAVPQAAREPAQAATPGIALERAYELTRQYDHVRYGFGAKHPERGEVDCSGWVATLLNASMDEINGQAGRTVFPRSERYSLGFDHAAGIVEKAEQRSGVSIQGRDVTPDVLREGMIIGEDNGRKGWDAGRHRDIDHIVMVVRDPTDGALKISQSRSGEGVELIPVERYLERKQARGAQLYATDPLAQARELLLDRGEARTPAARDASAGSRQPGPLREDDRGDAVRGLQESLNRLGVRDAEGKPLETDGRFGPRTAQAVEAFQRANGLEVDGVVGPDTRKALERAQQETRQQDAGARQPAAGAPERSGLEAMMEAARRGDLTAMRAAVTSFAASPQGREWLQQGEARCPAQPERQADAAQAEPRPQRQEDLAR